MTRHPPAPTGLRTVAALEAAKGILVMLAGLGLLSLLHHDVQSLAESVVRHLHLNPAREYPRVFIEAATRLTDARLWLLASGAFAYAVVRGVEAYGLWRAGGWSRRSDRSILPDERHVTRRRRPARGTTVRSPSGDGGSFARARMRGAPSDDGCRSATRRAGDAR